MRIDEESKYTITVFAERGGDQIMQFELDSIDRFNDAWEAVKLLAVAFQLEGQPQRFIHLSNPGMNTHTLEARNLVDAADYLIRVSAKDLY